MKMKWTFRAAQAGIDVDVAMGENFDMARHPRSTLRNVGGVVSEDLKTRRRLAEKRPHVIIKMLAVLKCPSSAPSLFHPGHSNIQYAQGMTSTSPGSSARRKSDFYQ